MAIKLPFKKQPSVPRRPLDKSGNKRPAFSYYSGDKTRKDDSVRARELDEHKRALLRRARLIPTLIAVSAILLSVAYSTTLSSKPLITFAGEQSPYRSVEEYTIGSGKVLNQSSLYHNKLTINTSKVETGLLELFPEADVIKLALPVIGRRPTVTMHVKQPALVLTTASHAYVLDSGGKVVAEANQLASSIVSRLVAVQDQSGLAVKVGDQALTESTIAFIAAVKAQLATKQMFIAQGILPQTPNEIDFKIKDLVYYLKTDSTGDARIQIGDFLATKESGVNPSEYMDLRVEEKVFYK